MFGLGLDRQCNLFPIHHSGIKPGTAAFGENGRKHLQCRHVFVGCVRDVVTDELNGQLGSS